MAVLIILILFTLKLLYIQVILLNLVECFNGKTNAD